MGRIGRLGAALLTIGAGYAGAFLKTTPEAATPDVQFHFIIFSADKIGGNLHPFPGFIVSVCQLRPESRGTVHIKSADPKVPPAIRYNYLATEKDRRVMVEGLKLVRRIAAGPLVAIKDPRMAEALSHKNYV